MVNDVGDYAKSRYGTRSGYVCKSVKSLMGISDRVDLVEEIEEELDNINISEKDFERIKKVWIANEVKTTDNITSMQRSIFSDIITYNKIIDNKIDLIRKMSFKKLTKIIKEIDFKNRSKLIALSNSKEQ